MNSVDFLKEKFKEILAASSSWRTLVGSQFVDHLATFVGWCVRDGQFKVERGKQEFFLSTAINDSSIFAHAEDREYIPRKPRPSSGDAGIENKGSGDISFPIHTEFVTDNMITCRTTAPVVVSVGTTGQVEVEQVEVTVKEHTVTEQKPFYEILLDSELSAKISALSVSVDMQDGEGKRVFQYARLLQNTFSSSMVYDEFYHHNKQIGIRFGNNTFGMILPVGAVVRIEAQVTEGDVYLTAGQSLSLVDEILPEDALVEVKIITAVSGGAVGESAEEVKSNLHYWQAYNEELVWAEDYEYFIKRRIPNVPWARSWGEEAAEAMAGAPSLDFINKIFISAYSAVPGGIQQECMDRLASVNMLNRKFEWQEPVHQQFTVSLTGKLATDEILTTVKEDIKTLLVKNYGKDSVARRKEVLLSEVYEIVQATGYFDPFSGANFTLSLGGIWSSQILYEMISIDIANSTINLEYLS